MRTRQRRHLRRGITLMETVVSLAIVGVTSLAALGAAGASLRTAERSRRALEAEALATQRLALLDLLTEQQLQTLPDSVADGRFEAPFTDYRWHTSLANRDEPAGAHDAMVRITWLGGAYDVHTVLYRRPVLTLTR